MLVAPTYRCKNHETGYLTDTAVEALRQPQQVKAAIGDAWVLPSPADETRPISRHLLKNRWYQASLGS